MDSQDKQSDSEDVERLLAWIKLLEDFLAESTAHYHPQSVWGRKKKALLAQRNQFIK